MCFIILLHRSIIGDTGKNFFFPVWKEKKGWGTDEVSGTIMSVALWEYNGNK